MDNSTLTETQRKEWLEERRKYIGSSDAAAIVGLNKYASAMDIYLDKHGLTIEKPLTEAMRFGIDMEEYIAKRFEEATGKHLTTFPNTIQGNVKYPWAATSVDRWISDEKVPVEIKTTSVWNKERFKNGEYPDEYYVQCVHHMAVMDAPYCYLLVYIPGVEFMWFKIDRNLEEEKALMKVEQNFYENHMLKKNPPEITTGSYEALKRLNVDLVEECKELKESCLAVDNLVKLQLTAKQIDEEMKMCKAKIMLEMESSTKAKHGNVSISWKTQKRKRLNEKKILELYPDILESEDLWIESESRVFKVTVKE